MDSSKQFESYYPKLRFEAILKSAFSGLAVGFAAAFVAAFTTWFLPIKGLWIALAVFGAATLIAAPIFYFRKFHPTVKSSARRIDRLGLEERLITMVEYRNDDSYIARLQRSDAEAALEKVDKKQIKLSFPRRMLIALAVCFVIGSSMTTVTALSDAGLMPGGDDIIDAIIPDEQEVYIAVTYVVEEGGYIEGEADQLVLLGENAEAVLAVAEDGYYFVGWDDGYKKPSRQDKKINEELVLTAIFEPTEEEGDDNGDGDGGEGDQPGDDGQQGDKPGPNGPADDQEGESSPNQAGGGKYDAYNQFKDGQTYYREELEYYKELLKKHLEENGDTLTEEEKAIIEAYIGIV